MSVPRCRTCGRPIVGCVETKHGGGWVHARTNAERCPPPHRTFAAPVTLEDLVGAKRQADRRVTPRR